MEMNFSELRKRKEHGVRKTMENQKEKQNIKKKLYPYLVIENLGTLKQRKKIQ